MAGALARLGVDRALVVSSEDGLDEMSTSAPTHVVEVNGDAIERYVVAAQDVGLELTAPDAVTGGTPDANAATTRAILAGEPGPRARLALLNAGAAIYAAGLADSLREGVEAAREAIDSGAALRTTERLRRAVTQAAGGRDERPGAHRRRHARRRGAPPAGRPAGRARAARRRTREDRPFSEALTLPGISVIAEHKRRSPSAGEIRARRDGRRRSSARTSAAAPRRCRSSPRSAHFGGSLEDLREARAASALPILRKDFVVDPYQVYESTVAGADAILLIVAALDDDDLRLLHREALGLDLDVLVEVHDEEELERALDVVDADVIGINNRDLGDFTVDVERTYELLSDVPGGQDGRLGVGLSHPRAARRPRARGGRCGARRRRADARARRRGRLSRARPGSRAAMPRRLGS